MRQRNNEPLVRRNEFFKACCVLFRYPVWHDGGRRIGENSFSCEVQAPKCRIFSIMSPRALPAPLVRGNTVTGFCLSATPAHWQSCRSCIVNSY